VDDKRHARLNCISHFLSLIPYKEIPRDTIKLPKRQKPHGYQEPRTKYKRVPAIY
jgi:polyphosphate kinase